MENYSNKGELKWKLWLGGIRRNAENMESLLIIDYNL